MTETVLNWVADTFARVDIIDLYFIVSDLVDIPISKAEACQTGYYDALALQTAESTNISKYGNTPIGKLVI